MIYSKDMIKVMIREVAEKREIRNPAELSRDIGVSKPTAARLWEGTFPVDLATLDKICKAWKCDLTKLVKYVPDRNSKKA